MKNRGKLVAVILGIFAILLVVLVSSYALTSYMKKGTKENVLQVGNIKFHYAEGNRSIDLDDAMPMTEEQGKAQDKYFDFKITAEKNQDYKIPYTVTARMDAGSDDIGDKIKIYMSDQDENEVVAPVIYSELRQYSNDQIDVSRHTEKVVYEGLVKTSKKAYEKDFRIRVWLDSVAANESYNQTETGSCSDPTYDNEADCIRAKKDWTRVATLESKNFKLTINVYAEGAKATEEDIRLDNSTSIEGIKANNEQVETVENENYDYYLQVQRAKNTIEIEVETESEDSIVNIERMSSLSLGDGEIKQLSVTQELPFLAGDNYYKITVTSANGKQVGTPKILRIEGIEPAAIFNVLTEDLGTEVEVSIDYLDHTNKKYKIGNGSYQNYPTATEENPNPTIKITSYEAKNYKNQDGTLTIYAKSVDSAGVTKEISEVIDVLDLDFPNTPVIEASSVFPTLTEYGLGMQGQVSITFDDRNDITNYVSLDRGQTWQLYTGNEKLVTDTVMAKSIKASGLEVSTTKKATITEGNALPYTLFDGDTGSGIKTPFSYKFMVDESAYNITIHVGNNIVANGSTTVAFYDANGTQLSTLTQAGAAAYVDRDYEVPEGASYGILSSKSGSYCCTYEQKGTVYEVSVSNQPVIRDIGNYPNLKTTGFENIGHTIRIKYLSYLVDKEYSVDGGTTWIPYEGEFAATIGTTIKARAKNPYGMFTQTTTYTVADATDAMESAAVDGDIETIYSQPASITKWFSIDEEIAGKQLRIYLNAEPNANATVKFRDEQGQNITIDNVVKLTYPVTIINVPNDTVYVGINSSGSILQIKEIDLRPDRSDNLEYPIITIDKTGYAEDKTSTIEYPSGYTNQYSTDNGVTWKSYIGPMSLASRTAIFARTIDDNDNVVSTSTFNIMKAGYIEADSILLAAAKQNITTGYSTFMVNNEEYSVHSYVYDGNQIWNESMTFGDDFDIATASENAKNMVIVKVNGDLTINNDVEIKPYSTRYGGPKGFLLYVTGTLTNNGIIDNSHGAKAVGQNVYLWKRENGTYEYVPATGATGGAAQYVNWDDGNLQGEKGQNGIMVAERALGGGGSGQAVRGDESGWVQSGAGGVATSYSGGPGGGSIHENCQPCGGTAGSGAANGGAGGTAYAYRTKSSWASREAGGGAGNPGGNGNSNNSVNVNTKGEDGTGGLLIVYAGTFNNQGTIRANGSNGGVSGTVGGSSGGGSVNIFYDNFVSQGTIEVKGGINGGAGGDGTFNIGSIKTGEYMVLSSMKIDVPNEIVIGSKYELPTELIVGKVLSSGIKPICKVGNEEITNTKTLGLGTYTVRCEITLSENEKLETSKEFTVIPVSTISGDSILSILANNNLDKQYYKFSVNGEEYPVHMYNYDEDLTVNSNLTLGDADDVATADTDAKNMVIVKVNGNLTNNAKIEPYSNKYGGPKGFTVYVTGTLTNNGTIDNSHGAKAAGQYVYLYKNAGGSYETVPVDGAAGGVIVSQARKNTASLGNPGDDGSTVDTRATGGGGTGGIYFGDCGGYTARVMAGAKGTSYSGGSGSGGLDANLYGNIDGYGPNPNGGSGGNGRGYRGKSSWAGRYASGGAGNPGGLGGANNSTTTDSSYVGKNGTGGLLIIYANTFNNTNKISANGSKGGEGNVPGGSSGGGSINIFYNNLVTSGDIEANGGATTRQNTTYAGGHGGAGTISIGTISTGTYTAYTQ